MKLLRRFGVPIAGIFVAVGLLGGQASAASAAWPWPWMPPPAPAPNCGTTIYKASGAAWTCSFDDEFNATYLDSSKWMVQTNAASGTTGVYACNVSSPQTVSESGGALHLSLVKLSTPVSCAGLPASYYAAGSVSTYHLFSQQYGRFEARMRSTTATAPGLHEAFWLWPDDRYTLLNWPTTGEMDVAETYSQYPNLVIPFLHTALDTLGSVLTGATTNTAYNCSAQRGVWNTYTLTWTPASVSIAINGTTCLTNTSANAAFAERYIVALTQAMGTGTNAPDPSNPLTGTLDVDYVRVWK